MANLGAFGADRAEAVRREADSFDTITAFGVEVRINPDLPLTLVLDMGDILVMDEGQERVDNIGFVWKALRALIVPEDFGSLKRVVDRQMHGIRDADKKQERAKEVFEALYELTKAILEHIDGRPTDRPSDSSDGPSKTGNGSPSTSSTGPTSTPVTPVAPFTAAPGETPEPDGTLLLPDGTKLYPTGNGGYTPSRPASS